MVVIGPEKCKHLPSRTDQSHRLAPELGHDLPQIRLASRHGGWSWVHAYGGEVGLLRLLLHRRIETYSQISKTSDKVIRMKEARREKQVYPSRP